MGDDEESRRPWWADPRTLLILALLGGTGIGGGGASLLGGNMKEEIGELRTQIVLLRGAVEAAAKGTESERAEMRRRIDDHEKRLRDLERRP